MPLDRITHEQHGFTLAELAERIGVSPTDVLDSLESLNHAGGYWLHGNRWRDAEELEKSAAFRGELGEVEVNLDRNEIEKFFAAWGVKVPTVAELMSEGRSRQEAECVRDAFLGLGEIITYTPPRVSKESL